MGRQQEDQEGFQRKVISRAPFNVFLLISLTLSHPPSDRKFAANIGARFVTPEEFFKKQAPTPKWAWGSPPPDVLFKPFLNNDKIVVPQLAPSGGLEVIIMVGMPASGKSTIAKRFETGHGYCRVSNDDLGNKAKCLKVASAALSKKQSVVVDNTNPGPDTRAEWSAMAKQFGASLRCIHLDTPLEVARHLNLYREASIGIKRIPDVAINTYNKHFQKPNAGKEGFAEVITIPFKVTLPSPAHQKDFLQWT